MKLNITRQTTVILTIVTLFFSSAELAAGAEVPLYRDPPQLGVPIKQAEQPGPQDDLTITPLSVPADRTGGWSVDIGNRQASRAFFNSVYFASEFIPDGWGGDVSTCVPGTTSSDFKNGVLVRVNFFREMAGVPSDITFNSVYNDKAQQAALMMSRRGQLSHYPDQTWACHTADGEEAASVSNLSIRTYGWEAIDGQMRDNGTFNGVVGHRRWILYPQTLEMGTGDIPFSSGYDSVHSLWVQDSNLGTSRPATREWFVAWPPPGYVPYPVVPPRWSFSYDDSDFSNATVTMTSNGSPVPVVVLPTDDGYGENTLVWVVDNLDANSYLTSWPKPNEDTTYTVTISNFTLQGGGSYSTSYEVKVFDPNVQGENEDFADISGPSNPVIGIPSNYTFSPVSIAESYEVLLAALQEGDYLEGAENGADNLIDNSNPSYDLITSTVSYSGTNSLHLAHPGAVTESFELDKTFIPSATGTLQFYSRLGWSTSDESVQVQVSQNEGKSWETIYDEAGSNGSGQSEFTLHSIPLADFADSRIHIRFVYHFDSGSLYTCSSIDCGLLVDDIQLQNTMEVIESAIYPFIDRALTLTGSEPGKLVLAVRAVPWDGYPGIDWGPFFYLTMMPAKVELKDAIKILVSLGSGSTTYTLTDMIEVLQVLTGN